MDKKITRRLIVIVVISAITLFYVVNNYLWVHFNNIPPYNDGAHHLTNCWRFINLFSTFDLEWLRAYQQESYPPFYYISSALIYFLFGKTLFGLLAPNLIFFVVLLLSIYAIGSKIDNWITGIIACVLFSLYPHMYAVERIITIDFALISMSTLSICLLLYSEAFSVLKMNVLFIVSCCLGFLTKQSFVAYIFGPLVVTIWLYVWLKQKSEKAKILWLIIIGGAVIFLLAYLFFYFNSSVLLKIHFRDAYLYRKDNTVWGYLFYYFFILPQQIGWPALIVFISSIIFYLSTKPRYKLFMCAWFFVSNIILILTPLKLPIYSSPLLPVVAILSAWGIQRVRWAAVKIFVLTLLIMFSLALHYMLLYNVSTKLILNIRSQATSKRFYTTPPYGIAPVRENIHVPRHNNWIIAQEQVVQFLLENVPANSKSVNIGITDLSLQATSECPWGDLTHWSSSFTENFHVLNEWGLRYVITKNRLPFQVTALSSIWKTIDWSSSPYVFFLASDELGKIAEDAEKYYLLIKTIAFQDNSKIYIYKRKAA
ncbi:MAG: glycosyltransferase family 39 protein [Candidatus Omnitrophota bacterium]